MTEEIVITDQEIEVVVFEPEVEIVHEGAPGAAGADGTGPVNAHIADTSDAHDASAISYAGSSGLSSTDVEAAIDELDSEKASEALAVMDGDAAGGVLSGTYPSPGFATDMATQAELDAHVNDASDAHDSTAISHTPSGNIAATDVGGAINELDSEKVARTPRITTIVSDSIPTINTDNCEYVIITALATNITSMTTNLSGTPNNFDKLTFRIKDNGVARSIAWGASFTAMGVTLPTTTVINKVLTVGFIYDTAISKWGAVASAQEA